ncbi:MAG: sugar phosphate nucleotidyltransferase [Patescibacteria group bacterium]|nr:sugar phosphate nucleotidyltransferase [Patescibacteria group bacterium]MDD4304578.1 sugar phosphate nucleotidyltransferase [Patescibacteria group bacterium]MDD4695613.1 sugar phosphate nucleotidyltransferase [Patescibacteria group bacterium]
MDYVVILAGGTGTRLWPISRVNKPKQSEYFFDKRTLLQITYDRVLTGFRKENIFISCGKSQLDLLRTQLPKVPINNFIVEPVARGTAMAIGLACVKIYSYDKNANIIIANADHFVRPDTKYISLLKKSSNIISKYKKHLCLVGIEPSYPEIGYGYIEISNKFNNLDFVYDIKKFKEKPDFSTATKYFKSKKFLWNTGWFIFDPKTMLDLFEKYLPKQYKALKTIEQNIDSVNYNKTLEKEFKNLESISIDYGIIEKTKKMFVIKSSIEWFDIGSWSAVKDCFSKNLRSNLEEGNIISLDSEDNLIINKNKNKIVSVVGVNKFVIIDTEDALFICPKNKSQEVKKIINHLKSDNKLNRYL